MDQAELEVAKIHILTHHRYALCIFGHNDSIHLGIPTTNKCHSMYVLSTMHALQAFLK